MKRRPTLEDLARRARLLGSFLAAAGAVLAAGELLGVPALRIVAAAIAAAGAVAQFAIEVRRSWIERQREHAALDRRLLVPVGDVLRVDPTHVGIDAAVQSVLPGGAVPEYVGRGVDDELRAAVEAAVAGDGPSFIVAVGPSKVGKSRALFEMLRESSRRSRLLLAAPVDRASLMSLMTPGEMPLGGDRRLVLWLDDLEPFIADGLTLRDLTAWRAIAPDSIVVGTYGGKGSERLPESDRSEISTIAGDLLPHAREVHMQATTEREVAELRAGLPPDEWEAIREHGLAAFLVAGPALRRKLATGDGADAGGIALMRAAADWARCGRTDPIDRETLRELWRFHLGAGGRSGDAELDAAASWACEPVAGRVALLGESDAGFVPYEYAVRLVASVIDDSPPPDLAWKLAIESATPTQATAVGVDAYTHGRLDDALRAWQVGARSSNDDIAAAATYNRGVVLAELGDAEAALAAYGEVFERFGDASRTDVLDAVGKALVNRGATLVTLGRCEEGLAAYADVEHLLGGSDDPGLRVHIASALYNKGSALGRLKRFEDALAAYEEVVRRFGADADPEVRNHVASALINSGPTLGELGRDDDELAAYAEIERRWADDDSPAAAGHIASALYNRGAALGLLGRSEEELAAYAELDSRFGEHGDPEVRSYVTSGLVNTGATLTATGRVEDALRTYRELDRRYGGDSALDSRRKVATALFNESVAFMRLGRTEDAVQAYDEIDARFGQEESDPEIRASVAAALFNKALAFGELGRDEDELAAYEEVDRRWAADEATEVRECVAKALFNKASLLGRLRGPTQELAAYDEIDMRYGADPDLSVQVVKALYNRALELSRSGRADDELAGYEDIEARFGSTGDPEVRVRVAMASFNRAAVLHGRGDVEQAFGVLVALVARYAGDDGEEVREVVERAKGALAEIAPGRT